jgi:hypothetical protein
VAGGANRYGRDFGASEGSAQDNFTDPESRIMKGSGGGFDQCYNGHTAVDARAPVIIAAELANSASDSDRLPVLLDAGKRNCRADAQMALADTGFRGEQVFAQLADHPTEIIVALGREGRATVKTDAKKPLHTVATASKPACERRTVDVRRSLSRPMGGSSTSSDFDNLACMVWTRFVPSRSSYARH